MNAEQVQTTIVNNIKIYIHLKKNNEKTLLRLKSATLKINNTRTVPKPILPTSSVMYILNIYGNAYFTVYIK